MKAKEKILIEAAKLFAQKGYAETSADEIIMNSGTSKGLLFYHYTNKDGLLAAVMEKSWEIIQQSCVYDNDNKNTGFIFRQTIKQMTNSLKRDFDYWKIYAAVSLNRDLVKKLDIVLHEPSEAYNNLTLTLFKKLGKNNPTRWAFFFDIQFRGVYFGYISDPKKFPLDNARQVMIDMFTR